VPCSCPVLALCLPCSRPVLALFSPCSRPGFATTKKRYSGSSRPALEHLCYLLSACSRPALGLLSASSRPALGLFSACSRPVLALFSPCSRPVLGLFSARLRYHKKTIFGQLSASSRAPLLPALGLLSASSRPALGLLSACSRPVLGLFSPCARPVLALFSARSRPGFATTKIQYSGSSRPALEQLCYLLSASKRAHVRPPRQLRASRTHVLPGTHTNQGTNHDLRTCALKDHSQTFHRAFTDAHRALADPSQSSDTTLRSDNTSCALTPLREL
jgi:hypothetical protein